MQRPARACNRCGKATRNKSGYCDAHQQKRVPFAGVQRRAPKAFYNSTAWKQLRKAFLAHPDHCICEMPGCNRPAEHADHIVDVADDLAKALDWNNLRGLCHSCHSRRTSRAINGSR